MTFIPKQSGVFRTRSGEFWNRNILKQVDDTEDPNEHRRSGMITMKHTKRHVLGHTSDAGGNSPWFSMRHVQFPRTRGHLHTTT